MAAPAPAPPSGLVTPLLPACAAGAKYTAQGAANFDPSSWSYYEAILPTVAPGITLGALALLGFLCLLIWTLVQYCICCCCARGRADDDEEARAQFLANRPPSARGASRRGDAGAGWAAGAPSVAAPTYGSRSAAAAAAERPTRRCSAGSFWRAAALLLALATAGISAWGIYTSLEYTDTTVSHFWDLVDEVDSRANRTALALTSLSDQLGVLGSALETVGANAGGARAALAALPPDAAAAVSAALDASAGAGKAVAAAQKGLADGATSIEASLGAAIRDMERQLQPPTLAFENTGRFVAIAVGFGLLIAAALVAGGLTAFRKAPLWAAIFVLVLWFITALLMLVGAGALRGVNVVASDACVYAESYAVRYVATKVTDPTRRDFIENALSVYLVQAPPADAPRGAAIQAVTGVDAVAVYALLDGPVAALVPALQDPGTAAAVAAASPALGGALADAARAAAAATAALNELDDLSSVKNVHPLYEDAKNYLCCDLSEASDALFIAWTVAGSLGLALALICSVLVIIDAKAARRRGRA
jgi:hypothetical protein